MKENFNNILLDIYETCRKNKTILERLEVVFFCQQKFNRKFYLKVDLKNYFVTQLLRPVSTTSVEKSILSLFYCFFSALASILTARFNRR